MYASEGASAQSWPEKRDSERIGESGNIQTVFLVNDSGTVQWKAKRGIKTPSPKDVDNIIVRSRMILSLAGMQKGFHCKFHYSLSRYDESGVLLFDKPVGKSPC